jgi:hypothetical protein
MIGHCGDGYSAVGPIIHIAAVARRISVHPAVLLKKVIARLVAPC